MKRIISAVLASLMLLSAVSCGTSAPDTAIAVTASAPEQLLIDRLGEIPSNVVLGDAAVAAEYGIDMTNFRDEGYIVRRIGDATLVLGKTEDGLDRAVRYFANYVYGNDAPADVTYGEGAFVKEFTVGGRDISEFVITVTEAHPEGSYPESTAYAATELASFIKQATGVTVPVIAEAELAAGTPHFRFTCDGSGENGEEGFTVTVTPEGNVEIMGGLKRGCIYAASDIAEKWLGMRFINYNYTHIYEAESVEITEADSYSDAPGMKLRYIYNAAINPGKPGYGFAQRSDIAARNKLNGNTGAAIYGYTPVVTANHGLYKYWGVGATEENPCMNDDDLNATVIDNIAYELEMAKQSGTLYTGNYYHVNLGQNDNNKFCYCNTCMKIAKEEGSYSGNLIRLVNTIAETFEDDYPEVRFGILAYYGTEIPCKT